MLAVISPAKTLDFGKQCLTDKHTLPDFLEESQHLIGKLEKLSRPKLAKLMNISDKLAEENVRRYQEWSLPFTGDNAKQALLAFKGEVYLGFDFSVYKARDFAFAQDHLRILSGLYGLLRPLDLIQPYRLEMGTKLKVGRRKDLYEFWDLKITLALKEALKETKSGTLVNLASNEYFSAVRPEKLDAEVIDCQFLDQKNGKYMFLSFYGKKARGMMADFIIRHRLNKAEDLKDFDTAGYSFNEEKSGPQTFVFTRPEQA